MSAYLQYVSRAQKIGDIGAGEELAWQGPVGLGTDRALTARFRPKTGDRIYLVSSLTGLSLPSLDAMVVVDDRHPRYPDRVAALQRAKALVFPGGPGSRWLPMLDASELLEALHADTGPVLGKRTNRNGRALSITQRLQGARTLRRLTDASSQRITEWIADRLHAPVFISYRSADGHELAQATAAALACAGVPIWYDQWSLSIRLDDLDFSNAETQLVANIERQLRQCAAVVQISTPEFGRSEWTQREQAWAENSRVFRLTSEDGLPALIAVLR